MSIFLGAIGFIIALGLLIAFHEYSHYWVAKKCGVRILKFSVGFGKPLYRKTAGDDRTEYVVGMLPLGGYVKMLDEREGEVAEEEAPRSFNRQPLAARAAIVAAGPAANLLLAFVLFFIIAVVGFHVVRPVIGEVLPGSPAMQAGLVGNDQVVSVAGRPVNSWKQALMTILDESLDQETGVALEVVHQGEHRRVMLGLPPGDELLDIEVSLLERLGIRPWAPSLPAAVGKMRPSGSAARSGLQQGDRVLAFDGREIADWGALVAEVRAHPGRSVPVSVERGGSVLSLSLAIDAVAENGAEVGQIGVAPQLPEDALRRYRDFVRYGPLEAVSHAFSETVAMSWMTLKFIARMVMGQVSFNNISGPLTIAEFAGTSFLLGFVAYLTTVALLSVSIGILNLLPIPVLDGGHLLYYLIEWVKGSPLSQKAELLGQKIGIAVIGLLILVAIYNDLNRLF